MRINVDELNAKNDRAWLILLKNPPTHRVEIAAHLPMERRGVMSEKNRPIFITSLHLKGFRSQPLHIARMIGQILAFTIYDYATTYCLVNSPQNDRWYYELILAVARSQLKEQSVEVH
jgi:hypothetical protein